jgi:hypothetical protein
VSAVDWNYGPAVEAEIEKTARIVTRRYSGVVPFDDLVQDGRLYTATHADTLAAHLADPEKGLGYWTWSCLRSALVKVCEREREHLAVYVPTDPAELPQRTAAETDRDVAIRVAQQYAELPGPKGDAARDYLAYLREEDAEAADLAEARHLTEDERAEQWRCLACARKLPEDCGHMRRYCDRKCQREYHRKRREESRPQRDCIECLQPMPRWKRPHATTCSDLCRDRLRRRRNRAA